MANALMIKENLNNSRTAATQQYYGLDTSSNRRVFIPTKSQNTRRGSSLRSNPVANDVRKRDIGKYPFNIQNKLHENTVQTNSIKLESKEETLLEKSIQLLPFNEEFSPDEFQDYLEGYEKNWENAIKVSEFSFEDLDNAGSVKKELGNFFDD